MPTSSETGQHPGQPVQCLALVPHGGIANKRQSASEYSCTIALRTEKNTSKVPMPSSPESDLGTSIFRSEAAAGCPKPVASTGIGLFETDCEVPKCDQRVMRQPSKWFA